MAPIEQSESKTFDSKSTIPITDARSVDSANFTIDFDDGSMTSIDEKDDVDHDASSRGDDPAAQWLGKVQAFEDLEVSNGHPAAVQCSVALMSDDHRTTIGRPSKAVK